MTKQLDVRYCVRGSIVTDNTALLDTIQSKLPDASEVILGAEYSENRTADGENLADGEERLFARMTFAKEAKNVNGTTVTPEKAAKQVFTQVTTHDLASKAQDWNVELYRTPEGAVTQEKVQKYYENNPSLQPKDEDGDAFIPSAWDPSHHVIKSASK